MGVVTFVDETTSGGRGSGRVLEVAEERLTVRELIRRWALQEGAGHQEPALRAFAGNGLLVLVGDRQMTGLDEEVLVGPGVEVTFLRLVPLAGG
ncbi:hypothetical protein [Streptomyces sp. NPDC096132]|uniref:hypothetical protein n=1 Tax=Streptomyces sp. NPDC096132 TaxID=3366075 RepID=UPI0038253E13